MSWATGIIISCDRCSAEYTCLTNRPKNAKELAAVIRDAQDIGWYINFFPSGYAWCPNCNTDPNHVSPRRAEFDQAKRYAQERIIREGW